MSPELPILALVVNSGTLYTPTSSKSPGPNFSGEGFTALEAGSPAATAPAAAPLCGEAPCCAQTLNSVPQSNTRQSTNKARPRTKLNLPNSMYQPLGGRKIA